MRLGKELATGFVEDEEQTAVTGQAGQQPPPDRPERAAAAPQAAVTPPVRAREPAAPAG
jgi:hypothetical protein